MQPGVPGAILWGSNRRFARSDWTWGGPPLPVATPQLGGENETTNQDVVPGRFFYFILFYFFFYRSGRVGESASHRERPASMALDGERDNWRPGSGFSRFPPSLAGMGSTGRERSFHRRKQRMAALAWCYDNVLQLVYLREGCAGKRGGNGPPCNQTTERRGV